MVLGGGLSKFARERPDGTPVDWMVEATRDALDDAALEAGDLGHTVVAYESEILARQLSMGQVFQDALGLCPKPSVRVEAGGGSGGAALRTAFAYLRGGFVMPSSLPARIQLVARCRRTRFVRFTRFRGMWISRWRPAGRSSPITPS